MRSSVDSTFSDNPYVDAQGRTDAETYLMGVQDGTIVAGRKLIKLADKMLPRIRNGYKNYRYDVEAATRVVEFIERFCYIPSGKLGMPFILEPYERMIVELMFGFVDEDGVRQIQYAFVEVARKNGKTSLSAAIALYMLIADGEGAPAVVTCASSKSQASLAFGALWRMVRQSPKLSKYLRKGIIVERGETGVICDANMGFAVPLSKASDHLDGLDLSFVLADELAAWKSREVWDLCRQAQSARRSPLMLCISTSGFVRGQIFDIELEQGNKWLDDEIEDDRSLYILFEQDDRDEIWSNDIDVFKKSNPGLGVVKSVNFLRSQILKAKNDVSFLPTLLTKDFNIPANEAHAFFTYEEAVNNTTFDFDPSVFRYAVCAFDAADSVDLNAACVLAMKPGDNHIYRKSHYWIPEEQVKINSNSMRQRDGIPYDMLAAKGELTIVPGNRVDRRVFVDYIQELAEMGVYTRYIGYDPWHMDSIVPDLKMLVGNENVEAVRQGSQTLSQPLKQLKADMRDGRIIDNGALLDHICNLNLSVKEDVNGNLQPIKKSGPTSRIDGAIALLIAYITLLRNEASYLQIIGWYPPEASS